MRGQPIETPPILFRGGLLLDPEAGTSMRADLLVQAGLIAAIGPGLAAPADAEIIDAMHRLVLPGLVNAHTHSPLNPLAGTLDALSHPAFMWRNQADTLGRTPDEVRLATLLGCIRHLRAGTSAVIDHFPEQGFSLAHVAAVVDAYRIAGLRSLVALRIFDLPYDDIAPPGGWPAGIKNPLVPPTAHESLALVEEAIGEHAGGLVRICPAPSNPNRCSDALLGGVLRIAEAHDTPIHTHLLETAIQARLAQERHGMTELRRLAALGLLGPRLSTAHTIWIAPEDIELFAASGAVAVHNPASNLKLGSGIAPVPALLAAGAGLALGSDGASTGDRLDMHEAMRLAAIIHRPSAPRTHWPRAADVLRMATLGGGRAMGVADLGRLWPGAPADLVLHDLEDADWVPMNNPVTQLVFAASAGSVRDVMVAGRMVLRNRTPALFDASSVLREAGGMMHRLQARSADMQDAARRMAALCP